MDGLTGMNFAKKVKRVACPFPAEFFVIYTRRVADGIRRRRQCRNCGQRITTTERTQGT
jgi:transcriptional regulator NrdR family protein